MVDGIVRPLEMSVPTYLTSHWRPRTQKS